MKTLKVVIVIIAVFAVLAVFSLVISTCNYANKAVAVAAAEVAPKELLRKYQWFKDASAQLDKKVADIAVYEARVNAVRLMSEPSRADKEQLYVWISEVAGVKASYNQLASEYNAQMAKINWRFTNVGDLPQGAVQPLPREYKPYIMD